MASFASLCAEDVRIALALFRRDCTSRPSSPCADIKRMLEGSTLLKPRILSQW